MNRRTALLGPLLALSLAIGPVGPAGAQVVVNEASAVREGGITEAAISACAGGAVIGLILASGTGAAGPTAGLFCGLSVAATVTASVATYTWRVVGSVLP